MARFYTNVSRYGRSILHRWVENGKQHMEKVDFSPTLYAPTKQPTDFYTLYGNPVKPVEFDTMNDARDYLKRMEDVDGFEVSGMTNFEYQFISKHYPGEIDFSLSQMVTKIIDIETTVTDGVPDPDKADEEILLVSYEDLFTDEHIVFGSRPYTMKPEDKFQYVLLKDEKSLLREFMKVYTSKYPDNITGWNIRGFDLTYLINRITKILGETAVKRLSPWGQLKSREIAKFGNPVVVWDIVGVNILDYLDVYQKYTYSSKESYALGFIAQEELGETKVDIGSSFEDAYTNHWDIFVPYNAKDTHLVRRLEEKFKFLEVVCSVAFLAKCNLNDTFGPVKTWDVFIYNHLLKKNVVIPPQKRSVGGEFEGAWVKEPVPGLYGWGASFDFSSLYPSIIQQWNMSPETIVGVVPGVNVDRYIKEAVEAQEGLAVAANGAMFRKDIHGVIPEVIKVTIRERKIAKKEMLGLEQRMNNGEKGLENKISSLNARQMALKIL